MLNCPLKVRGRKSRDDKGREVEGSGEHLNIERCCGVGEETMKSKKEGGRGEIRKVKRVREEIRKKSRVGVEGEKAERRCGR